MGKTLFFENHWLEIGCVVYEVDGVVSEATEPGFGYQVDVLKINDPRWPTSHDAALTVIKPGCWTPPQYVFRQGSITDYPLSGSGRLLIQESTQKLRIRDWDCKSPDRFEKLTYGQGSFICWVAGSEGLSLIEVCWPPYKAGDLLNLKLEGSDPVQVPPAFREKYLQYTKR